MMGPLGSQMNNVQSLRMLRLYIWLRAESCGRLLWLWYWPTGAHNRRRMSWTCECRQCLVESYSQWSRPLNFLVLQLSPYESLNCRIVRLRLVYPAFNMHVNLREQTWEKRYKFVDAVKHFAKNLIIVLNLFELMFFTVPVINIGALYVFAIFITHQRVNSWEINGILCFAV